MMRLGLDITLLFMLSMFCFQTSVCARGRGLSRTSGALSVEGSRRRLFPTFNVKSFGAKADGNTDNTDV